MWACAQLGQTRVWPGVLRPRDRNWDKWQLELLPPKTPRREQSAPPLTPFSFLSHLLFALPWGLWHWTWPTGSDFVPAWPGVPASKVSPAIG